MKSKRFTIRKKETGNRKQLTTEAFAKQQKRDRTKLKMLNECRLYLESGPNEAFVKQMLSDSKASLERIDAEYDKWSPPNRNVKNLRAAYDTIMGTKKKKSEIKRLKYLLS